MKRLAVADSETNPAQFGATLEPFVWGFYDGCDYVEFWSDVKSGKTATEKFVQYLANITEPLSIFAHNGGKFDWLFMIENMPGNMRVIGSRIVKAQLGIHELRDSFANIPVPLKQFGNKLDFDYSLCLPEKRNVKKNQVVISEYLKQDCVGLFLALERYRAMFGDTLTMASAALQQMNLACTGEKGTRIYEKLTPQQDALIRPFYFGGRVQAFQHGVTQGQWNVYDVRSMYPSVMRDYAHPISNRYTVRKKNAVITEETDFAVIDATTRRIGCLPLRSEAGGLSFPLGRHQFCATGPEIREAQRLGLLHIHETIETITFHERVHFRTFVDKFFTLRKQAQSDKDKMLSLFYKLVLNSAYGKLAINPEQYEDVCLTLHNQRPSEGYLIYDEAVTALPECPNKTVPGGLQRDTPCLCDTCVARSRAWRRKQFQPDTGIAIYSRPIAHGEKSLANVAGGASITAHARAKLLHGIYHSERPIYCDTDAIICEGLKGSSISFSDDLGNWQHEAKGHTIAIGGKKLYALYGDIPSSTLEAQERIAKYGDASCVKLASKGVKLTAEQVRAVAMGGTVRYRQEFPVFDLTGKQSTLTREIRMTQ